MSGSLNNETSPDESGAETLGTHEPKGKLVNTGIYSSLQSIFQGLFNVLTGSRRSVERPLASPPISDGWQNVLMDDTTTWSTALEIELESSLQQIEQHVDRLVERTAAAFTPSVSLAQEEMQSYKPKDGEHLARDHRKYAAHVYQHSTQQTARNSTQKDYMQERVLSTIMLRWRALMFIAESKTSHGSTVESIVECANVPEESSKLTLESPSGASDRKRSHKSTTRLSFGARSQAGTSLISLDRSGFPSPPSLDAGATTFRCDYCDLDQPAIKSSPRLWE